MPNLPSLPAVKLVIVLLSSSETYIVRVTGPYATPVGSRLYRVVTPVCDTGPPVENIHMFEPL